MSSSVPGISCANCVYYEKTEETHGECHRYAPHPNSAMYVPKADSVGQIKFDIHWPRVYDNNWCGQFGSRKKPGQPVSDQ
ncbi:MAG: hypothetical protein L0Y36_05235 [Planctomycetales bacterium]|nr:hypothetical protein [Planctomycetales bacterium]